MNFTKKIVSLLFALLIYFSMCGAAFAIVAPSSDFYVTDMAGVLSAETERQIINYNGALEAQCNGAQIVVVTVKYLDGMYCDEYAYQLFNNWGVGSSQYNNGMLLLLATEENKAWLAYGLGLNDCIDEDTVDDMLEDHFWSKFDRGRYDEAVSELFMELLEWYDDEYSSSSVSSSGSGYTSSNYDTGYGSYYYYPDYNSNYYADSGSSADFGDFLRFIVVIAVFYAIFGGNSRRGGGSWLPWYLFFNSVNRNRRYDYRGYNNYRSGRGGYGSGSTGSHGGFSGGSGGSGGHGGGFGGGSGHGGGGFSGGGGGRR